MKTFIEGILKKRSHLFTLVKYLTIALFFLSPIPSNAQIRIANRPNIQKLATIDTTKLVAITAPVHPPRIALIIGNSTYAPGNELEAPVNNADVISNEMLALGFEVTLLKNLTRTEMRMAIVAFGRKARHATTAFVYFSGHTVKFEGVNYMVPIDALLDSEDRIKDETLSINYLINKLNRDAQNRISIDSCYPSTFGVGTKDLENELCFSPPTNLPDNVFISFSAFENQSAPTISSSNTSLFSYLFSFNLQRALVKESFLETKKLVKKFSSGKEDIYFYGKLSEHEYWGPFMKSVYALSTVGGYPKFAWPPPFASATEELDTLFFSGSKKLSDVNSTLLAALDSQGYHDTSHYAIEEGNTFGFAIATKLEQINEDASTLEGHRWNQSLVSSTSDFSLSQYLKSLFFPRKGFFRVIVFAVVNAPFSMEGETDKEEVITWVGGGASNLADTIGDIDFKGYRVFALIYEYRLPENDITAKIEKPCEHSGRIHLVKSGLWAQLAHTE